MIKLDLSKSGIKNINYLEQITQEHHKNIWEKKGLGNEMLGWLDYVNEIHLKDIEAIEKKVKQLKKLKVKALLVIGIGGSFLGALSGINFLYGGFTTKDIHFVGTNLSASHYELILKKLEKINWAICVISKSGTTLEPALAFKFFSNKLSKKIGRKEIRNYIVVITDPEKGALRKIAIDNNYPTLSIPNGIGGRFSVITPVGLFPLAFLGMNIHNFFAGIKQAMKDFSNKDITKNLAYQYALTRWYLNLTPSSKTILQKKTKKNIECKINHQLLMEIFVAYDNDLVYFNEWLKQLFGESEGKDGKGLFPSSALFTQDLHSLGQYIQEGKKMFFLTTIWVEEKNIDVKIPKSKEDYDGYNQITSKSLETINTIARDAVMSAHYEDGNTPNILIKIKDYSEKSFGYLIYFFFISVTMSGYLLGVNPFNQPGVEVYKKNLSSLLKK